MSLCAGLNAKTLCTHIGAQRSSLIHSSNGAAILFGECVFECACVLVCFCVHMNDTVCVLVCAKRAWLIHLYGCNQLPASEMLAAAAARKLYSVLDEMSYI